MSNDFIELLNIVSLSRKLLVYGGICSRESATYLHVYLTVLVTVLCIYLTVLVTVLVNTLLRIRHWLAVI
jgi:hypothetical protein